MSFLRLSSLSYAYDNAESHHPPVCFPTATAELHRRYFDICNVYVCPYGHGANAGYDSLTDVLHGGDDLVQYSSSSGAYHACCDDGQLGDDVEVYVSCDELDVDHAEFYASRCFCALVYLPNNDLPTSRKEDQTVLFDVKATVPP